ncbi:ATP-binding protein [Pseudodesulfovibrio profundus]|uniref:ATP-binding protein n=1 Tax=Pseudodesulfovibrio profundus TaxID=57320 RepID=UPI001E2F478D|nr:ATP-binding protein [Pseudodesulfovibrio profundus]
MPQHQGNPLIEALPPLMDTRQVREGLAGNVHFDPQSIYAGGRERAHIISSLLDDFFQPLSAHVQLEEKISIMIRRGYVGRNLADGSLNTHLQNGYERVMKGDLEVNRFAHAQSTASSLSLIGCSGSGKSTTITRIFATYPQVIYHEDYNFTQITYLKIDCPHDGTLKNLCIQFFRALDRILHTDYETKIAGKRLGIEQLLAMMSQVANAHAVGVLVIDEIQHLDRRRAGGVDKMLNFFVTLVNTIGLPVIFVGTPKARPIFEKDLRSARRGAGFGSLIWEPMKSPEFNKKASREWIAFTNERSGLGSSDH